MTNARPRRAGHGAVDAQSIKKVTEVCKDASPEDAQAALAEHNGDVQAAVMSLLDNPFQSVEKKKRRPQRPTEREERPSNRDFPHRDNDRRGHDRGRGGGRGRGGDRSYDSNYDGTPARGRGRGGRGRGRGPPREPEPVEPPVDFVPPAENDFGSEAPAVDPPVEEAAPPVTHRVQQHSAPRPVSSAVVSDGSISWAQKIKARAAPVQPVYEPEQPSEYDDRSYHEPQNDDRALHNGVTNEAVQEEPAQVAQQPHDDGFGSGYGHDAQASAWESTHQNHQTSAWSTSVSASPEIPLQDPHLKESQQQPSQHQSFDQPPPGMQVGGQTFPESKPFDLRDLAGTLPATSTVQEEGKPGDFFDLPTQEPTSQPPGFGPPGLQQNSPLSMFANRSRPAQAADSASVPNEARDPSSLINGGFGDFGHGLGAPVSMPQPSDPQPHHSGAPVNTQQPHHSHAPTQAPPQPSQGQEMTNSQAATGQQNQQEVSNEQSQAPQLPPDHSQHAQHVHSFETAFPGHAAPDSHRSSTAKVNSSTAMFMPEPSPGDRMTDGPQSQTGPQNAHSQDQDKPYVGDNKGNNTNTEQQNHQLPSQTYQQVQHEVNNWGVPMQTDLYGMQRPASAQLTPPGMTQMVPGMGQMPSQPMQAQYPMNPNMPAPGYGAPGYPPTNYPQQMGYAPGPYMQPGYNMQYPNSGYPYPGQMAPQAYAPSPSGPQMYGGPSGGGFGKQQGYMADYNTRGTVAGGSGGVPGAGTGRGRGRGKNQKGRMAPSFSPQGGMHADPYNSSQAAYMDPGWMAQNQRFDAGFGKDKNVQPQHQYPHFGPGGYENPGPYGYGQFAQHSQFPQQAWNGQDKGGVGAAKGNF